LNECEDPLYNDCGENSVCINTFGGFICECKRGYGDRYAGDKERSGRECETCPDDYCNNRGSCSVLDGSRVCQCTGNYYGDQCEVDGEVLAVAVGASVAAVIIILLTLVCLCMWSRRWKREQEKVELSRGYTRPFIVGTLPPPPTYHTKMPPAPNWAPPAPQNIYGTRWPDAQQNIYAQPEPGTRRMATSQPQQPRKIPIIRTGLPPPPISTIPRPNTSMGNRTGSHPLLDTSESEETEASASKIPRPRSSMLMGTVNLEDDFETDYPRFSGTIGVRNPRFVAAMRNAYVQQQHIQMNMMNRFKQ